MNTSFDIERSKSYWRFVPSGEGKHNSAELAGAPDSELESTWDRAFASRFLRYPEEDRFMQVMAASFKDKQILSIGSGMGFHELYYRRHGAHVTCFDIVPTNLEIIRRVAAIKGLPPIETFCGADSFWPKFDRTLDVAFIYGSLMAMPAGEQRQLLERVKSALRPDGTIVLMLYTWKFAESTCGWRSPSDFDPTVFARASDPSVGAEHCPWSDWHDDAKLLDLAGPGMRITRRQLWQHGLFVWYELAFGAPGEAPLEFFDRKTLAQGSSSADLPASAFQPAASRAVMGIQGLIVETDAAPFGYAAISPVLKPPAPPDQPNTLRADVSLLKGGISVGLLDTASQTFVNTAILTEQGRHNLVMPLPRGLSDYQVIFSNHRADGPAPSSFVLHRVELARRESVVEDSRLRSSQMGQLPLPRPEAANC